jgi:hypothetical protein
MEGGHGGSTSVGCRAARASAGRCAAGHDGCGQAEGAQAGKLTKGRQGAKGRYSWQPALVAVAREVVRWMKKIRRKGGNEKKTQLDP